MENEKRSGKAVPDLLLYSDLYKNSRIGEDACARAAGKAAGLGLRQELADAMNQFSDYSHRAAEMLTAAGAEAKDITALDALPAELGFSIGTALDPSDPHIAELMLDTLNGSVTDMKKAQKECAARGCSQDACRSAEEWIQGCSHRAERLREFL